MSADLRSSSLPDSANGSRISRACRTRGSPRRDGHLRSCQRSQGRQDRAGLPLESRQCSSVPQLRSLNGTQVGERLVRRPPLEAARLVVGAGSSIQFPEEKVASRYEHAIGGLGRIVVARLLEGCDGLFVAAGQLMHATQSDQRSHTFFFIVGIGKLRQNGLSFCRATEFYESPSSEQLHGEVVRVNTETQIGSHECGSVHRIVQLL